MSKQIFFSDKAPKAIGPYSHAIKAGDFVYLSGQTGVDPATGALVEGVQAQTLKTFEHLKSVLATVGATLADVVKTTVFLSDMNDFSAMNEVYAAQFGSNFPARSCVQVARLPKDAAVEIELVAYLGK